MTWLHTHKRLSFLSACLILTLTASAHLITVQSSVCGTPMTYEVDNGATVMLVATPEAGSQFVRWSDGNTSNPRSIVASSDATYTAVFEKQGGGALTTKYTLTICAGDCTNPCVGEFNAGSSVSITAVPLPGYKFMRWSDGNTSNPRNLTVNANISFCAEFEAYTPSTSLYTVNVQAEGCSNIIEGRYPSGTELTLIAQPSITGCDVFTHWDNASTSATRVVTINANADYTASFGKTPYTITFQNYDGTILQSGNSDCGEIPVYVGATPTKSATTEYVYVFNGWTPTIVPVSGNATYTAVFASIPKTDVLNIVGEFSVSPTHKVNFSHGNLQYNAAQGTHECADGSTKQGTWRFAEHQWDYVGDASVGTVYCNGVKCDNALISSTYNGWVDLFGWGTSGWNGGAIAYQPYSTSANSADYYAGGDANNDLTGTTAYADWGVYNDIDTISAGTWRTLTYDEWQYVYSGRENATSHRSLATVHNIKGYILLPDNWIQPNGTTFLADAPNETYNNYSDVEWFLMENAGAVFLPSGGHRYSGVTLHGLGTYSYYWSSTHITNSQAWRFMRDGDGVNFGQAGRISGSSIRLVCDCYTIATSATNGIVTGGGTYIKNSTATLTATPNTCYQFTQWSDGNTDNPRTITVTGDATYTAEFTKIKYTISTESDDDSQGTTSVTK